jgi:chorismate dehydratase
MPTISKIRIGAVSYLNTKPLIYDLPRLAPQADLILDYPSRLADSLAEGGLDVALIPSIEFFQDPGYTIVSDACIGCRGPVLSVKLYARRPMNRIRSVALDEGSRTSAALTQVLLSERFGIRPRLEKLPLDKSYADTGADAVLVIGDRAMHEPSEGLNGPSEAFEEVWDLGEEWVRWSGLPFVFAMWTARSGRDLSGVETALEAARDAGERHLGEIAAREAAPLGLTQEQCLGYLRDNLYFHLGPREWRGLALFHQLAQKLDLAPAGVQLGSLHVEDAR